MDENVNQEAARPPAPPLPPPPLPPPDPGLKERLERVEAMMAELAAAMGSLKRTFASEGELSARLAQAETGLSSLKALFEGQGARLRAELDSLAQRDAVDELRVNLAAALSSLGEMKLGMAQYSDEIYALGRECRKALGEAQGLAKAAARAREAQDFPDFFKEAAAAMNSKLADMEVALHSGLSELSSRVGAAETLCGKVLASAEERLGKSFEPRFRGLEGQVGALRDNLIRLNDDYSITADRRIRALEAKYSAFEAMARRMEAVDALLKERERKC